MRWESMFFIAGFVIIAVCGTVAIYRNLEKSDWCEAHGYSAVSVGRGVLCEGANGALIRPHWKLSIAPRNKTGEQQ